MRIIRSAIPNPILVPAVAAKVARRSTVIVADGSVTIPSGSYTRDTAYIIYEGIPLRISGRGILRQLSDTVFPDFNRWRELNVSSSSAKIRYNSSGTWTDFVSGTTHEEVSYSEITLTSTQLSDSGYVDVELEEESIEDETIGQFEIYILINSFVLRIPITLQNSEPAQNPDGNYWTDDDGNYWTDDDGNYWTDDTDN